jgi:hypothetical protein
LLKGIYDKGRGKHKKKEQDILYKCFDFKKCGFSRQLSHTHGATDSFSKHLEVKHKIFKDTEETTGEKATKMKKWLTGQEELPLFEDALID